LPKKWAARNYLESRAIYPPIKRGACLVGALPIGAQATEERTENPDGRLRRRVRSSVIRSSATCARRRLPARLVIGAARRSVNLVV
jgi:hypothetical protein